jgi:hypothetical protein
LGETRGPKRRLTLRQAADVLGISKEAVRKRAIRGSLPADKDPDGRVYVCLDVPVDTEVDAGADVSVSGDPRDRLIAHLQGEVEAWREEARRKDHIIAGLIERLPPQLEESQEPSESSVAGTSPGPREEPFTREEKPQERRRSPWWRRMFGG